jgi:hypothetical protein
VNRRAGRTLVFMVALLGGLSALAEAVCGTTTTTIPLTSGPEDVVAWRLDATRTRLFVRQKTGIEILTFAGLTQVDARSLRGPEGFAPLGMSLVRENGSTTGTLYVIDRGGSTGNPTVRWYGVRNGLPVDGDAGELTATEGRTLLQNANDLEVMNGEAWVTRYDPLALLRFRARGWPGLVRVRQGERVAEVRESDGMRGFNGIVSLGPASRDFIVADYWNRRLMRVTGDGSLGPAASAELPIHPDNLTRDGSRILIAGQRYAPLAALNLLPFMSWLPSPSEVYAIEIADIGEHAMPARLWKSEWGRGRSVSVAVRLSGGLALGQIAACSLLVVSCP